MNNFLSGLMGGMGQGLEFGSNLRRRMTQPVPGQPPAPLMTGQEGPEPAPGFQVPMVQPPSPWAQIMRLFGGQ